MGPRRSGTARSRDREAAAQCVSIGVAEPAAWIAWLRAARARHARGAPVRRRFSSGAQHGEPRGAGDAVEHLVRRPCRSWGPKAAPLTVLAQLTCDPWN